MTKENVNKEVTPEQIRKQEFKIMVRSLSLEAKKWIWDQVIDEWEEENNIKNSYVGFDERCRPENWEEIFKENNYMDRSEPYSEQKTIKQHFTSSQPKLPHKYPQMTYRPQIIRHSFMLSLWKIDELGANKIKGQYFSLENFSKE